MKTTHESLFRGVTLASLALFATLMSGPVADAHAADAIGVPCARDKLLSVVKAIAAMGKCYTSGHGFGSADPECVERAQARMVREFLRAEQKGCFGPQDDEPQMKTFAAGVIADLLRYLGPPPGCGLEADGFTCGGACPSGFTCGALGEQCGCFADAFTCNDTALAPVLCPKIGQTCVGEACQDPAEGYCREEPIGSGHAIGFCRADSTCVAWPQGSGPAGVCIPRLYACEDPAGACMTNGSGFGFCDDASETCGPDCLCH
jgi:hypothetical protein